ncbi:HNH nucleases [Vibrio sp. B1FIG11]|nr:HNH nucleases [Vibrio sp. B1FIG11]CAE6902108.1 HNH nucleases [Vibrio sp. B1FIG11]
MAIYNTASDSANTAVRAFLTKVGEHYLGHSFNTGSGKVRRLFGLKYEMSISHHASILW